MTRFTLSLIGSLLMACFVAEIAHLQPRDAVDVGTLVVSSMMLRTIGGSNNALQLLLRDSAAVTSVPSATGAQS